MRVFLSYASDDQDLAARVAESIRSRGHRVFFDRTELPSGGTYEDQIEAAILRSDLMVFLISPDSVAEGRFTRTELGIAQRKWKVARNRVLPVTIRPTPIDDVPAFLRAVTILEPEGSAPAEIASAVDRLGRRWKRILTPLALAALAAVVAAFVYWTFRPPAVAFDLQASAPSPFGRGFFGEADVYQILLNVKNSGVTTASLANLSLEFEPRGALIRVGVRPEIDAAEPEIMLPGATFEGRALVSAATGSTDARWRLCAHFVVGTPICTPFEIWTTQGEFPYADTFEIPNDFSGRTTAVAWDGAAYLVATAKPDGLVRLGEDGDLLTRVDLPGVPKTVSAGPLGLFVGLSAPNQIIRLHPDSLVAEARLELRFPAALEGAFGDPISNTPADLAQSAENLWVITRGGAAANGLGYLDPGLTSLTVPPYYNDISFDLPGMTLRSDGTTIWSGDNNTTPASIRRLTSSELEVFGGHDFDIASCASDILPLAEEILVPDCDGVVHRVVALGNRLDQRRPVDSILGFSFTSTNWPTILLDTTTDGRFVGAVTISSPNAPDQDRYSGVTLSVLDQAEGSRLRLSVAGARIVDMAVGSKSVLLILQNNSGKRQLVAADLSRTLSE